jgi:hypothetical protein
MVDSQSAELASMQKQIAQIDQTSTEVMPLMQLRLLTVRSS